MTRYFIHSLLFLLIAGCISSTAFAGNAQFSGEGYPANETGKLIHHQQAAARTAALPTPHSEAPHGKTQAPHLEEVPHIHKFHKERLKKIRRYRTRYWLPSKLVLILCHLSLLLIAYLHATH